MLNYSKRVIATVDMVVRFDRPEGIRRLQFDYEDALKGIFSQPGRALDQSIPFNAPNLNQAPIARWMLNDGRKTLVATDQTINLNLNFQGNSPSKGLSQTLTKYASEIDKANSKILGTQNILFAGIVAVINFSYGGSEVDVSKDIAETFLKQESHNDVSTAQVTIGFSGRPGYTGFNFIYQFSPYRSVEVQITGEQIVAGHQFDISEVPSTDRGLQIRVDVNDRKSPDRPDQPTGTGKLEPLIPATFDACKTGLISLLGTPDLQVDGL